MLALTFSESLLALAIATVGLPVVVAYWLRVAKNSWIVCCSLAGMTWAWPSLWVFVAVTLKTGEKIQGQLYHEDGPFVFFILVIILLFLSCFVGVIAGLFVGIMADGLEKYCLRDSEMET